LCKVSSLFLSKIGKACEKVSDYHLFVLNDKEHDRLDVKPTKNDYPLRKEIKKRWENPKDKTEYNWGEIDNKKDGYSKKEENIIKKYFK